MIKINTKLLDFGELVTSLNHSKTWLLATELNDIKIELEIRKEVLIKNLTALVEDFEELCIIEEQLIFINKNLITVRTALDYHETKITEHRLGLNDLYLISLN